MQSPTSNYNDRFVLVEEGGLGSSGWTFEVRLPQKIPFKGTGISFLSWEMKCNQHY